MTWLETGCRAAIGIVASLGVLAAGAVDAQQSQPLDRSFDVSQPIDISADSLEVRQKENIAVFQGNVAVIQGRIRLRADRVKVHYRPRKTTGVAGTIEGGISKLEASGNVFISSPSETAQGKTGVYDVDNSLVSLSGGVVLTRGKNVLRGERLVINLATGVTKLDGGVSGGAGSAKPSGRVRGIFHPDKKTMQKQ